MMLKGVLQAVLTPRGFGLRKGVWFRVSEAVVEVVELQKSKHGEQYYINYGCWIRALGDAVYPKPVACHIRERVESLVTSGVRLATLLGLEGKEESVTRSEELRKILEVEFLPLADSCRTLVGLRTMFKEGRFKGALIRGEARGILADD